MARPIEYKIDDVLQGAMGAFWKSGYAACSMQMLVDATGLSRQSIYSVFGDKHGLFQEVLKHYRAIIEAQCSALDAADADLSSLRSFILEALDAQSEFGSGACLFVVTAFSPQSQDPHIKPALDEGAMRTRSAFETVLDRVREQGLLSDQISPNTAASQLYAVMNGLSALRQTGGTQCQIESALDLTFDTLKKQG